MCLPRSLQEDPFKAYHDDLGHQGRDRTLSLLKQRFFVPGLDQFVRRRIQQYSSCIRRKAAPVKAEELVNMSSTAPMELVCIDYLSLERSKGGYEKILVITDHFTRYAQAFPTRNGTAQTTARVLYENYFIHYGFPSKIHSDKGASFESKTIKKLCETAGIKKSRTTPYHPMANGMVERFNKILLNMLGTLHEDQRGDWKSHVSTLTHAYNAAVQDSTGFSTYYLMYGRHPRLAVDAFFGLKSNNGLPITHKDYSDKLKDRLQYAYKRASEEAQAAGKKYKKYYDENVRHAVLEPGDRVLVRNVGLKGCNKLADQWERFPHLVVNQTVPDIPIYRGRKEHSNSPPRLLHRNMP